MGSMAAFIQPDATSVDSGLAATNRAIPMKEKDPKPIQELAVAEAEAGVDYIDINLGPARKGGEELMEWVVKVVQEVIIQVL